MRKALMGLVLAATVLTPIAAQAQDGRGRRGQVSQEDRSARQAERAERQQQRVIRQQARQAQPDYNPAAREQRQAQRQQVEAQRQQMQAQRQQVQAQRQQYQAQRQQVQLQRQLEARQDRRQRQSVYPNAWQGNPNDPARARYEELERRNQYRYGTREQRRDVRQEYRQERREDRREYRQDRREDRRDWRQERRGERRDWRNSWNRQAWRNDRRYDWQRYRYSNRNLFRMPAYYSPYRGYGYNRFSIGLILEPLFYNQRYWISDPWQYRLPYAPAGTQWVRYYNDVLLVDTWSGEVVDVIYDFFW